MSVHRVKYLSGILNVRPQVTLCIKGVPSKTMDSIVARPTPAKGFASRLLDEKIQKALAESKYTQSDGSPILYVDQLPEAVSLFFCSDQGITDVSYFAGVKMLSLGDFTDTVDVSALGTGRVRELYLENLAVTDVSALGCVRILILRSCRGLTDVSALGGVKSLCINGCTGVSDVSALEKVKNLSLVDCPLITDVSALGEVKKLYLRYCIGVSDVSPLRYVKKLSLVECPRVTDVSMLGRVKKLCLGGCTNITDYSAVPHARR